MPTKMSLKDSKKSYFNLHSSIPCTEWCTWQTMAIHKYGEDYRRKLANRQKRSARRVRKFFQIAKEVLDDDVGSVTFEWPKSSFGWKEIPVLKGILQSNRFNKHVMYVVNCVGNAMGMTDQQGNPILKRWRIVPSRTQ